MSKKVTNLIYCFLGFVMLFSAVALFSIKAEAAYGRDYILGETYDDVIDPNLFKMYRFSLENRTFLSFTVQSDGELDDLILIDSTTGARPVYWKNSFTEKYDKKTKKYTYTISGVNNPGLYDLELLSNIDRVISVSVLITAEPEIVLDKTVITEMSNTRQCTMTVKYNPVKKRLGYQIEYSTDNKFKNKNRVNTGATSKDVGKLTRGKTYYVRVRSYARYSDGTLVYSKWSGTRKIKITK